MAGLFGAPAGGGAAAPAGGGLFGAAPAAAAPAPASASGGLFGAAPAAAPAPASASGGLFGAAPAAAAPAPVSGGLFGAAPAAAPAPASGGLFGAAPSAAAPAPAGAAGGGAGRWLTKAGRPVSFATPWAELHPDTQKEILRVEGLVREHRDECRRLGDLGGRAEAITGGAGAGGPQDEAEELLQGTRTLALVQRADRAELDALREDVSQMVRDAEGAVRGFQRATLRRQAMQAAAQGKPGPASVESLGGPPPLPPPFLERSVDDFAERYREYQRLVHDLEQAMARTMQGLPSQDAALEGLESLPEVVKNVALVLDNAVREMEATHCAVDGLRQSLLKDLRKEGNRRDPFKDADRREAAEKVRLQKPPPAPTAAAPAATAPATTTAPTPGTGLFGAATTSAPTPGGGLFGGAKPSPLPMAPLTGANPGAGAATPAFGAAPAAAPAFGAAPAAAPAFGAAPAAAPAFGAAPAAAPAFGAAPATPTFGAAPAGGGLTRSATFGRTGSGSRKKR